MRVLFAFFVGLVFVVCIFAIGFGLAVGSLCSGIEEMRKISSHRVGSPVDPLLRSRTNT